MLLAIGVGVWSVPGGEIEKAVRMPFPDSEINPIFEHRRDGYVGLMELYLHTQARCREAKHLAREPAQFYLAVGSGIVRQIRRKEFAAQGPARLDVAVLANQDLRTIQTTCLNPEDIRWQLNQKKIALASCVESVTRLMLFLHKMIPQHTKSLPRPSA